MLRLLLVLVVLSCSVTAFCTAAPEEEQFLNSAAGIDRLALGIYKGLANYSKQGSANISLAGYAAPAKTEAKAEQRKQESTKPATQQQKSAPQQQKSTSAAQKKAAPAQKPQFDPNAKSTYKVVILWSYAPIPMGDPQFKGRKDVKQFNDNGIIRYSVGGDFTDQQQAFQMRAALLKDFPKAFVCTFQKGVRVK